jgi:hypothetical protein
MPMADTTMSDKMAKKGESLSDSSSSRTTVDLEKVAPKLMCPVCKKYFR